MAKFSLRVSSHSQATFVGLADKFYDAGRPSAGARVLRQGANFQFSSIQDLLILTTRMCERNMFEDVHLALSAIDQNLHTETSLCQLARAYLHCGKLDAGAATFSKAVADNPKCATALLGLASIALAHGADERAVRLVQSVLADNPSDKNALAMLAHLALNDGDIARFETLMGQCQIGDGRSAQQHSYAAGLLSVGEWDRGWAAYALRETYEIPHVFRNHMVPTDLSQLDGKKVCLIVEQAFGDIIQFVRFAALCHQSGADVHMRCNTKLHQLFSSLPFPITCHSKVEKASSFDAVLPLFSIPSLVKWHDLRTLNATPYLAAEPEKISAWQAKVDRKQFNVAIAWQGNPNAAVDIGRSLPTSFLGELLDLPQVKFHCLQIGDPVEDATALPNGERLIIYDGLDDGDDAFLDSAALMQSMDLVVTTDTSLAHLGGALGVPSIIMLKWRPDWRWQRTGDTTPWYPEATLVRQPTHGDWHSVVNQTKSMMVKLAAQKLAMGTSDDSTISTGTL